MPAALVVTAVVLPLAAAVAAPLDRQGVAVDGAAAAVSLANVRFALAEGDYFATLASPSPFLHFWSLGVEEQFYLAWPLLLLAGARGRRPRIGAAFALGVVLAASLLACVVATDVAPAWAFYMLPTRAWQLSVGGLLAIAGPAVARVPGLPLATLGWAGLAAVIAAPIVIDPTRAYPGITALLPTLGAAALIAAGERRRSPARLLAIAPLRGLGRISYSLYLWHWPILVVPAAALGVPSEPAARLGLVIASVAVAAASWALVEEPFRRAGWSVALRPARTLAYAAAGLAFVVAFSGGLACRQALDLQVVGVASGAEPETGEPGEAWVDDVAWTGDVTEVDAVPGGLLDDDPEDPGLGSVPSGSPDPSASPMPTPTPTASATARPRATPRASYALPRNVRPALGRARGDVERLRTDGCLAFEPATAPLDCVYGRRGGRTTVALVGDSHASHLFPAFEAVARKRGWRLETYVKVSCPFIDMRVRNLALKREYTECTRWRAAVLAHLADEPPDIVIVSNSRWTFPVRREDGTVARQAAALARMIGRLPGTVVVVADTPAADRDIPGCLSRHARDIRECAIPRSTAFSGAMRVRERTAARESGAGYIDLTRAVCPGDPCDAVVRGMIVLRDDHHLTATFARSLAPALDRALAKLLAPPAPPPASAAPSPTPSPSAAPSPAPSAVP